MSLDRVKDSASRAMGVRYDVELGLRDSSQGVNRAKRGEGEGGRRISESTSR